MLIIPCFNRRAITLGCLDRLKQLGVFDGFHIIVVDDASTDGTAEAIARDFPEVEVLRGSGELYWTGSIELGMRHAYAAGADCFVWINDDTVAEPGAIQKVTERAIELGGIASGQGYLEVDKAHRPYTYYFHCLYKGWKGLKAVAPALDFAEIKVDTCRGNLVAVSRRVVDGVGFPDGRGIPHFAGDTDYGLRATAAGFPVVVIPSALVREIDFAHAGSQSWLLGPISVRELCRSCLRKKHVLYPPAYFTYHTRHWGLIGLATCLFTFLKVIGICLLKSLIPRKFLIFLFGRFSHAWRAVGEG